MLYWQTSKSINNRGQIEGDGWGDLRLVLPVDSTILCNLSEIRNPIMNNQNQFYFPLSTYIRS